MTHKQVEYIEQTKQTIALLNDVEQVRSKLIDLASQVKLVQQEVSPALSQYIKADQAEIPIPESISEFLSHYIVDAHQCLQLTVEYLSEVLKLNQTHNLTRIVDYDEVLNLHLIDSLLYLPETQGSNRLVDIGTGAGFPGVVLGLFSPQQESYLLDSNLKKISSVNEALDRVIDSQTLDSVDVANKNTIEPQIKSLFGVKHQIALHHVRVEDFAREYGAVFDTVVARAVAPLNILLEYSSPLLMYGGKAVFSKGHLEDSELQIAKKSAQICGMELMETKIYELPQNRGQRTVVIYVKAKDPEIPLPRRAGMALKRPLGG